MNHFHNDTSVDNPEGREQPCSRRHLPTLELSAISAQLGKAKSLVTTRPATVGAPGLTAWVASGHTHGETTWAVVILTGLMLASETALKIANARHTDSERPVS